MRGVVRHKARVVFKRDGLAGDVDYDGPERAFPVLPAIVERFERAFGQAGQRVGQIDEIYGDTRAPRATAWL